LEEERRLAYVGITRARQRLYVSRAVTRSAWGQPQYNPASRFVEELPPELVRWEYGSGTTGGAIGSGREERNSWGYSSHSSTVDGFADSSARRLADRLGLDSRLVK